MPVCTQVLQERGPFVLLVEVTQRLSTYTGFS